MCWPGSFFWSSFQGNLCWIKEYHKGTMVFSMWFRSTVSRVRAAQFTTVQSVAHNCPAVGSVVWKIRYRHEQAAASFDSVLWSQGERNPWKLVWWFPEIGLPPNHPLLMGFSIINQLFWGSPIYGNPHMGTHNYGNLGWRWWKGTSTSNLEGVQWSQPLLLREKSWAFRKGIGEIYQPCWLMILK